MLILDAGLAVLEMKFVPTAVYLAVLELMSMTMLLAVAKFVVLELVLKIVLKIKLATAFFDMV